MPKRLFFRLLKIYYLLCIFFVDVSCRTKQKKIEKRNRKLIDYDGQRHSFQNLQASSAKRKDDVKVTKGREQLEEAKRTYEILNTELHDELPALNDSRILFLVTNLQTLFASEQIFHNETQKVCVSGRCLFVATFFFFSRSAGWVRWRVCVCTEQIRPVEFFVLTHCVNYRYMPSWKQSLTNWPLIHSVARIPWKRSQVLGILWQLKFCSCCSSFFCRYFIVLSLSLPHRKSCVCVCVAVAEFWHAQKLHKIDCVPIFFIQSTIFISTCTTCTQTEQLSGHKKKPT